MTAIYRYFWPAFSLMTLPAIVAAQIPAAPAEQPIQITVQPGAQQTFRGFGASALNFGGEYQQLTAPQRQKVSHTMWHDLGFPILRLWFNTKQYAPAAGQHDMSEFRRCYVDSHIIADARKNGVTTLLLAPDGLPAYMTEKRPDGAYGTGLALKYSEVDNYAILLADFIQRLHKDTGIKLDVTGIQNEPNDIERFTPAQIVQVVKRLRQELDSRGLQSVKIIAPENANVDGALFDTVDALKADPVAWKSLAGIGSHSYNNATNDPIAQRVAGTGKEYWMTEASANGPEAPSDALQAASLASRFLGDMNHRVTHWIHFVGFEVPDPNDNATRIMAFTTTPFGMTLFQKYYYYQQLSQAFNTGAVFRRSESSLDRDMAWNAGKKPHLTAGAAKNLDGTWSIGLSNYTSPTFQEADDPKNFDQHNSGHSVQVFTVTITAPELAKYKTLRFQERRSSGTFNNQSMGTVLMHNGVVTVTVNPLELITLRSLPKGK